MNICIVTILNLSLATSVVPRQWKQACILPIAKTRNSSGDEIANVNFLYDDIVHALKMQ